MSRSIGPIEKIPPFRCPESCDCNTNSCENHRLGIVCQGDKCSKPGNHCAMQWYNGMKFCERENVEIRTATSAIGIRIRGLYARKSFSDGQPIIIYAGKVLTIDEAVKVREQRQKHDPPITMNYQVEMRVTDNLVFIIDPYERGNCAGMANSLNGRNNCDLRKVP